MAHAKETKLFGLKIRVQPKLVLGGLIGILAASAWFMFASSPADYRSQPHLQESQESPVVKRKTVIRRSSGPPERDPLKLTQPDSIQFDTDPRLNLQVLADVRRLAEPASVRNLFRNESRPVATVTPAPTLDSVLVPVNAPPATVMPAPPAPMTPLSIKYCGSIESGGQAVSRHGTFSDGDGVVFANEGDVVAQHYLVVKLTKQTAVLQDVQTNTEQVLAVPAENTR